MLQSFYVSPCTTKQFSNKRILKDALSLKESFKETVGNNCLTSEWDMTLTTPWRSKRQIRQNCPQMMNELNTYIPPNIRLINPISKLFTPQSKIHSRWAAYLGRAEPGPNAKINCLFSHRHMFGHFLNFQSYIKLHFSLPTFSKKKIII